MKIIIAVIGLALLSVSFAGAQTYKDIRKISFGDFTHQVGKKNVKFSDGLQVGACPKSRDGVPEGDIWNVVSDNIAYGDLDGDGKDEAFVPLAANVCGGTMITDEALLVYTLKNGKAVKLPEFSYVDDGCKPGEKDCNFTRSPGVTVEYAAEEKALVVKNYYAAENDASCCPSMFRRTWYKWNGRRFEVLKKSEIEKTESEEN